MEKNLKRNVRQNKNILFLLVFMAIDLWLIGGAGVVVIGIIILFALLGRRRGPRPVGPGFGPRPFIGPRRMGPPPGLRRRF
jgi:hypothetical protein